MRWVGQTTMRVLTMSRPSHFPTNRLCRLAPAHQGMKSWSCGLVQRNGTANSAAPHPDPCGGQAPALHFSVDYEKPIDDSARVAEVASPCWCYFRANRPCRLPPAPQGTKIGSPVGRSSLRGLGTRVGCWSAWGWGQAPALHFSLPAGKRAPIRGSYLVRHFRTKA